MDNLVVVKVGSSVLVQDSGELDYTYIANFIKQIIRVIDHGIKVVIVTSGAISAGKSLNRELKSTPRNKRAQVYYAIGQPKLIKFYSDVFSQYGRNISQLILSREAFSNKIQYFSIRDTLRALIHNDIIPIVNDNDILHDMKDNFSDNDHLASYLGGMLSVDKVIFISQIKGIYRNYPGTDDQDLIREVNGNFDEIMSYAKSEHKGSGGIQSKINSAKLLYDLGIESFICSIDNKIELLDIINNTKDCTHFIPDKEKRLTGVRKWLCTGAVPKGVIKVSRIGADIIRSEIKRGSLLAKGIMDISGVFYKGDVVSVCDDDGRLMGYGITKFSSQNIVSLLGKENIIVIHADYFYGTDFGYFG